MVSILYLIRWGSVVRVHSSLPDLRAKFALIFYLKNRYKPLFIRIIAIFVFSIFNKVCSIF